MNTRQYLEFLEEVRLYSEPCKYGHLHCSNIENGRCSDEEYANLSEEARALLEN